MRALVAGAGGNVGRELVRDLLTGGHEVVAIARSESSAVPDGALRVVADLNEPAGLDLDQVACDAAFVEPGYRDMAGLASRVRSAGAERVVLLSGLSAGNPDPSNAITMMMRHSEAAVRSASASWTIVRPAAFMSNCLRWAPQLAAGDVVTLPFPHVASAMTHPADIAAVAAQAMTGDGHDGRVYLISGPQALTPHEQVTIVAQALRRPLRFVPQSDVDARAEMTAQMPAEQVEALWDFYVRGSLDESIVYPTVVDVTGAEPRSLAEWAAEHRTDFPSADTSGSAR